MSQQGEQYPVQLSVEFPDRALNRTTTFFRLITVIPIAILVVALAGTSSDDNGGDYATIGAGGVLFLAPLLMIVFRQKYPTWWFDWNVNLVRLLNRVAAYALLLRDEYPSTDDEQAVHILIGYPDVERDLNRWLPLVKWLLAFPHYILLSLLWTALLVAVVVAWFAILLTRRYPRGIFAFVVGVLRWSLRVEAYALLLTTDRYPPFRLGA
jgi:hypothetical protein